MPITITELDIEGLLVVQPTVYGDDRGYFFESYNERDLAKAGLNEHFVQDNQSFSSRGTLRGLHFQKAYPQGKLVRVISGEVYDIAVDLRRESTTWGQWRGITLSDKLHNQFYIPPGFAHGFLVVSENALFAYKCTEYYHPEDEGGIRWDDPELAIDWPLHDVKVSSKDAKLPYLSSYLVV